MRALLALLMGCAPTKKTAPDSDVSTEPTKGAQQDVAKPAKRGAGTLPQAVKQAAAVDEDAQRIAKEAAAAVAAAEPLKLYDDEHWRDMGGASLESALQVDPDHGDSPVALIDARYIVELWKRGGKILRRQDLPKEAFIDLETVKRLPWGKGGCLRVIAVSHPWQQPDHPDPKEVNLTLLAKVLERFIADTTYGDSTYACFFDFMSCFQKGPDGKRTDKEMALFGKALSNMMVWYGHPKTMTFKLTRLPKGYPNGFKFPEGMKPNMADYWDRGWCFCESSVSNLVKDYDFVLDLAKFRESVKDLDAVVQGCAAKRAPPLAPPVFKEDLSTKTFTSPKADLETVGNLYEKEFDEKLGEATLLRYYNLQWTDADVVKLCGAIATGKLVKLEYLYLSFNQIGDAGVAALAEVAGKLPHELKELHLGSNPNISQQAEDALKAAIPKNCEVVF